jgi:adenylate kinase
MRIKRFNEQNQNLSNIIFLGPPGSGKGTMTNLLKDEVGYNLVCTGDILRAEKKSGSELGKKIAGLIDAGNLVPDEIVDEMIENELSKVDGPVLLDGYPRTIAQAENLDRLLDNLTVVWLDVPEDVTIQRNLERGKTSKRPDDANVDVIKQRLDNYNKETAPVKEWYDKSNRVIEVDGVGPIPEVLERIKSSLNI